MSYLLQQTVTSRVEGEGGCDASSSFAACLLAVTCTIVESIVGNVWFCACLYVFTLATLAFCFSQTCMLLLAAPLNNIGHDTVY